MEQKDEKNCNSEEEGERKEPKTFLGIFTREKFIMLCVVIGLIALLLIITLTSVFVITRSDASVDMEMEPFPSDGDMLEFLLQIGEIQEKDGLYATWYHAANNKSEMNKALNSDVMILEADVNVKGYNTANETNIPIMAHPPDIYSDNTLEEWLEAVLKSKKGIKLDFKSINAVEPSLDLLRVKNQTGINRPVWINADILPGPNVPVFWPVINASEFFEHIQLKFPDVTISPGWKVLYLSIFPNVTYTRSMVEEMYSIVRHLPQKITFPVHALMAKNGWPHLSWLLSQSSRFSLTLWQGKENPTVNDLLFIRDNSNPLRIYYDIYEPVLSQFKEAAKLRNRPRRFYPGGDIIGYFRPMNRDGLNIQWDTVTNKDYLLYLLEDSQGGMLVIPVISSLGQPNIPVIQGSQPELPLQDCLELILASKKSWGIYLRIKSQSQLSLTLELLRQAYDRDLLHHPTWVNMDIAHGAFYIQDYVTGAEFLRTIDQIFPYVTLAPGWPKEVLDEGYKPELVEDMVQLFQGAWQDVSLQLHAETLYRTVTGCRSLLHAQSRFSMTLEHQAEDRGLNTWTASLMAIRALNRQQSFYNMPNMYREHIANMSA
ncbi:protein FAM151A [Sinocyclocheilus rhinocerous]|uniref:protein FAM151A n=1 Tax=Sinocyclocheilus rhinocerous TaxID=307959 RepID=UPI0007B8469F|nr:PREDICTED: protein FAM151A [Sinocyclocheilus rhinocerous]